MRLPDLLAEPIWRTEQASAWRWATVLDVSPLQIRFDTQPDPIAATPLSLTSGLVIGDRVWCQLVEKQVIILGKAQS